MDELSGRTVDLVDLVGAEARRLAERIRDAASWNDRFALVDRLVFRQVDEGRRRPDPEVEVASVDVLVPPSPERLADLSHDDGLCQRANPAGTFGAWSTDEARTPQALACSGRRS